MYDDYPEYDEWFGDFLHEVARLGYNARVDKEGVRGYYEVDEQYPDEAAKRFVAEMQA